MFYLIKDDYSAKISEEFISLIKEIKNMDMLSTDVLTLIDTSFKRFLGISSGFANSISEADLLEHIKKNGKIQGNACVIAAALLYEEGKIYRNSKDFNEAYKRFFKGFSLILNIFTLDLDCEIEGYKKTAADLAAAIEGFELFPSEQKKLFTYYNSTGNYSKAEDYLYELLDSKEENSFAKESLKEFYNNLLTKNDEELINGNLPRGEILEALEQFKLNN